MNHKSSKFHRKIAIASWGISLAVTVACIGELGVLRACPTGDRALCQSETSRIVLLKLAPSLLVVAAALLVIVKSFDEERTVFSKKLERGNCSEK